MYDFEPDLDPEGFYPHQMSVTDGHKQLGCVEQEETHSRPRSIVCLFMVMINTVTQTSLSLSRDESTT